MRHSTEDGDRLIWNWEVNQDWYYNWTNMVNDFREKGMRVMNYVNPFFSNPINLTSYIKNNFYQEGLTQGYFVKDKNNESYSMNSLTIQFYTLDLTNPAAVDWMKNKIIKNETILRSGSSGFMCDFGEYLPYDSVLYSGESASSYHNKYPEQWVKLVSEAISEMNATDEIVFFARSGYSHSPKYLNLFWLGDQLISYDSYDGMGTLITAALSVGLSGQSFVHSDIGGYNSFFSNTTKGMYFIRDPEILQRWSEFSAFGSSLFRTHIGASMNNINAQIYDSNDSLAHFRKFAMIYSQLSDYRFELMDIAINNGQPLMMPMLAQYFYDKDILKLPDPPKQFLFGSEFIVSPSMVQGETFNRIYIPAQCDVVHLWSGNNIQTDQVGMWINVPASIGFPNVFYQKNSIYGNDLRQFIIKNGFSEGYSWNYNNNIAKTNSNVTLYIILSICILIFIVTAVIYRMKKSLFTKRAKYEKLSVSEIITPLVADDEKISINY